MQGRSIAIFVFAFIHHVQILGTALACVLNSFNFFNMQQFSDNSCCFHYNLCTIITIILHISCSVPHEY